MSYSVPHFKSTTISSDKKKNTFILGAISFVVLLLLVGIIFIPSNSPTTGAVTSKSNGNAQILNYTNENVFNGKLDQNTTEMNFDGGRYRICYSGDSGILVVLDEANYPKYLNYLQDQRIGFFAKFIDKSVTQDQKCNTFDINNGENGKYYILKDGNNIQAIIEKLVSW